MISERRSLADLYLLRARIDAEIRAEEKRRGVRQPRPRGLPPECGTESGYQAHRHLRQFDCEACRLAHAEHNRRVAAEERAKKTADARRRTIAEQRALKNDVDPIAVERFLAGDDVPTTQAERRAIVARWRESGRSLGELEKRTGRNTRRYYEVAS